MSQVPAVAQQRSIVSKLAEQYGMEGAALEATLCETIFPSGGKATKAQVASLCIVADQFGLNPFAKQIYAFPAKGGGITPIIAVDGWYKILNEHPMNDGFTCIVHRDDKGKVMGATATLYRKDRQHPFVWTEELDECYRNTDPWNKTTSRMMKHRAICQAVRVCYAINAVDPDEGERIAEFEIKASAPAPSTKRSLDELLAPKVAEIAQAAVVQPEPAQSATQAMADEGPWAEAKLSSEPPVPVPARKGGTAKPKQAEIVDNTPDVDEDGLPKGF